MSAPVTRRDDVVEVLHGTTVADPWRWLEDTTSPEVHSWVRAQQAHAEERLAQIGVREEIRARLTELWDVPVASAPQERGGTTVQWRNAGLQDQPVLWLLDPSGDRVLLDPNVLSEDGTTAVSGTALSPDGRLLAWGRSDAGSDWITWHVREVATATDLADAVPWSKFCLASWLADSSGFLVSRAPTPAPGEEHLAQTRGLAVWLHRLEVTGGPADEEVFPAPADPELLAEAQVSHDGRWAIVTLDWGTRPQQQVHVVDLASGERHALVDDLLSSAHVVASEGDVFWLETDWQAPLGRVVRVTLGEGRERWREVVAETDEPLIDARCVAGELLLHRLNHACSRVHRHALDGTALGSLALPPVATVIELTGHRGSRHAFLRIASFTDPGTTWRLRDGVLTRVGTTPTAFDPDDLVTEQVFVGRVPMFLVHRRDVTPTGEVRVLLHGYGGFMIPKTPDFSAAHLLWVERGGLLAVACLRGGGEYGQAWHDDGRREHKQHTFDDLAACGRWLVAKGWTSHRRIGVHGRSNGGLLAGAALTRDPALWGAVVPEVGVLDMLRFHLFTVGWAWTSDYGDPRVAEELAWLLAYSPLHHVRDGVAYPPTLLTTGDTDDRVAPGHTFKMAAALQAVGAPAWLRVDVAAGHGAGKPTGKVIAERVDVLAFLEDVLGGAGQPVAAS